MGTTLPARWCRWISAPSVQVSCREESLSFFTIAAFAVRAVDKIFVFCTGGNRIEYRHERATAPATLFRDPTQILVIPTGAGANATAERRNLLFACDERTAGSSPALGACSERQELEEESGAAGWPRPAFPGGESFGLDWVVAGFEVVRIDVNRRN